MSDRMHPFSAVIHPRPTLRAILDPAAVLSIVLALGSGMLTPRPAAALPDGSRVYAAPSAGAIVWSEWSDVHDDVYFGTGLGFMIGRHWGIEGTLAYNPTILRSDTGQSLTIRHLGVDLKYQLFSEGRFRPYLGAGWTEFRYDLDGSGDIEDYNGWEFGAGVLMPLREESTWRASLRLDARDAMVKFDPPRPDDGKYHHNFVFSLGLQVEFGEDWHEDLDADGVIDRFDDCLDTAPGVVVDGHGCGIDSDGDSIFDGLDQCPGTPAGAVIDSTTGCPIDSDGDGVFDGLDKCEDTPQGALIDGDGCPLDGDKDGVFDGLDACPDTPSAVRVDAQGCPAIENEQERALAETGKIVLTDLRFESGKAELDPASVFELRDVAEAMRKWPDLKLEIGGHTDALGSDAFNQKLSQERAEAVRLYLIENFDWIDGSRLTAVGYGESQPVADNTTEEGRAQNRRVEFEVLSGGPKAP